MASNITVGVCGAGAMGAGIAQVAAKAGHPVTVYDLSEGVLAKARTATEQSLQKLVDRKKISAKDAADVASRIQWQSDLNALAETSLVIEAIVEDLAIKQSLFSDLEKVVSEDTILATNTSSLSVTALAATMQHPDRLIGLHFFNPAPIMRLVEVISGLASDPERVAKAASLMTNWGKTAVVARDVPGFIVNRVARPYYSEGWRALEEGVTDAATIDYLYRELGGFRMGPLELGDLIGHDINFEAARSIYHAYFGAVRFRPARQQGDLVAGGLLGRKSERGVYDYRSGEPARGPKISPPPEAVMPKVTRAGACVLGDMLSYAGVDLYDSEFSFDGVLVGDVLVTLNHGRSAGSLAVEYNRSVAVIDTGPRFRSAPCIAYSASDADADCAARFVALALSRAAICLADRPGLIVTRTWAQLANAACDALGDQVANGAGIDAAMQSGVNYPVGPLDWAKTESIERIRVILRNIADETGDQIYQPSEFLNQSIMEARA